MCLTKMRYMPSLNKRERPSYKKEDYGYLCCEKSEIDIMSYFS